MSASTIKRFLTEVRPSNRGYLFTLQGTQVKQTLFASNHEAEALILKSIARNEDVFVSLAQFKKDSPKRESTYAEYFASVWIDIDVECGDGKAKPYSTRATGMDALEAFILETDLPRPSILVNSGGGIHAYWCFSQIIAKSDWEPCAKAFKAVCLGKGLQIDKSVTADAARVMRVPGSQNWKLKGNPRPVLIIEPNANDPSIQIDFDAFAKQVITLQSALSKPPLLTATLPGNLIGHLKQPITALTKSLIGNAETPEAVQKVESALSSIDPDITYPEWFRALCALKSTDWDCAQKIALTWSAKGAKFDADVFEKQWAQIKTYGGVSLGSLFHMAQQMGGQRSTAPTASGNPAPSGVDHPGDIRNGKAYATMHRGTLIFVKPMGRWFRWDGNRWAICLCEDEMEAAKQTAKRLLDEAARVAATDPDRGKRLFAHALQTQNLPRLEAMIRLASSEFGMVIGDASQLDADPWMLGVRNGVVDLRSSALLPPEPERLITKQCNAAYAPEAVCLRWMDFLDDVFSGDLATIESVQRLLGYTLTGSTTEEKMVICYGHGANGKSVFSNVVSNIIGEYYTVGPNCLLVARGKNDNSVRNDLAKLFGARLISVNELAAGARLDEQVIKQLAGREPISARFLHKEFFDFLPTGKVWLRTNHRPVITGEDDGIWRRLVLLHFKRKFSAEEQDCSGQAISDTSIGCLAAILCS